MESRTPTETGFHKEVPWLPDVLTGQRVSKQSKPGTTAWESPARGCVALHSAELGHRLSYLSKAAGHEITNLLVLKLQKCLL